MKTPGIALWRAGPGAGGVDVAYISGDRHALDRVRVPLERALFDQLNALVSGNGVPFDSVRRDNPLSKAERKRKRPHHGSDSEPSFRLCCGWMVSSCQDYVVGPGAIDNTMPRLLPRFFSQEDTTTKNVPLIKIII